MNAHVQCALKERVECLVVEHMCVQSAVETRNRVARELQAREKEKKEQELRDLAMRARTERGGAGSYAPPPAAARYLIYCRNFA